MHRSPIDSRHLSLPLEKFIPRFANDVFEKSRGREDSSRLLKALSNLNPSRLVTRDLYISDHLFSVKICHHSSRPSARGRSTSSAPQVGFVLLPPPPAPSHLYTRVQNQSRSRIIVPKRGSTLSALRGDGKLEVTWCDRGD